MTSIQSFEKKPQPARTQQASTSLPKQSNPTKHQPKPSMTTIKTESHEL